MSETVQRRAARLPHVVAGVDPGETHSGLVVFCGYAEGCAPYTAAVLPNADVRDHVVGALGHDLGSVVVIERPQFFGRETRFTDAMCEALLWSGRFIEAADSRGIRFETPFRKTIVTHHTGSARSNDADVRHALVERYGGRDAAIGNKAKPGPLWEVKSHAWQALAAALCWIDQELHRIASGELETLEG